MTEREPERARAMERLDSFAAGLHRSGVHSGGLLERPTAEIFAAFAEASIDALLLKGAGLAQLLYKPGEHRAYADVDLLVPPAQLDAAAAELSRLGYANATEQLGIDDVGGVVHSDTWVGFPSGADQQIVVEVHRWLPGAQGDPADAWNALWARRTPIELGGREVPVPGRDAQALQLATHVAQHGPGFVKGRMEMRMALERWPLEVWQQASALAAEIDAAGLFAAGLRIEPEGARMAATLGLPEDPEIEWEVRHGWQRPRGTFHVRAWQDAAGFRERLGLIRRALLPSRRWLIAEFGWAERGGPLLVLAWCAHMLRAPLWAARAWLFRSRRP